MLLDMDHPWRRLRALKDWLLAWAELPAGIAGLTDFPSRTIVLDRRLTQASRRCVLAHELEHVERRILHLDAVLAAREEEAIDRVVARRLIPLERLADALAWSTHPAEVADVLWVDEATLAARVRGLHPVERAYLARRMEHHHAQA